MLTQTTIAGSTGNSGSTEPVPAKSPARILCQYSQNSQYSQHSQYSQLSQYSQYSQKFPVLSAALPKHDLRFRSAFSCRHFRLFGGGVAGEGYDFIVGIYRH